VLRIRWSSCQVAWNAVARMRALSLLCIHLIVHASPCLLHLARISLASNPQTLSLSAWRTDCGRESNASNSFCLLMEWILTHMGWVKRKFGKMYDRKRRPHSEPPRVSIPEIGRASCRERGE